MNSQFDSEVEIETKSMCDSLAWSDTSDFAKYHNLGLSLTSQELICDFHLHLNQTENGSCVKLFEEVLYSVIDDIQKYKQDAKKFEGSIQIEKEKHDEKMKSVIEEAENQLSALAIKIKEEESLAYKHKLERIRQSYESELAALRENVIKLEHAEQTSIVHKVEEDNQQCEIKMQLKAVNEENKNLNLKLRTALTEVSLIRSENAQLKIACSETKPQKTLKNETSEVYRLKREIDALNDANQKLNDANDLLENQLNKYARDRCSSKVSSIHEELLLESGPSGASKSAHRLSQKTNSSFDTDDDLDSGCTFSNADCSGYTFENDNCFSVKNTNLNRLPSNTISVANANSFARHASSRHRSLQNELACFNTASPKPSRSQTSPNIASEAPQRLFKVIFAGDTAVGKTSFIMQYCNNQFTNSTSTTLGVDFRMKLLDLDGKSVALQLWDTCGQERYRSLSKSYFRRTDGIVLMYDCCYEKSFANVKEWLSLIEESTEKPIPVIIVGNKTDLRETRMKNRRVIEHDEGLKLAKEYDALFVETSAKNGTNVEESLIELCRLMSCNQDIELKTDYIKLEGMNEKKKKMCC